MVVVVAALLLLYASSGQAATVTILVGSDWFCDESFQASTCETVVYSGDTVRWTLVEDTHNVIECSDPNNIPASCSGGFSSGYLIEGMTETFEWTFDYGLGTYNYYCDIHLEMRGRIVVVATPSASASPSPSSTPSPTPTPSPSPIPSPSVSGTPSPTLTPTGTASPPPTPSASPTSTPTPSTEPSIHGDADCDGDVDELDAIAVLLKHYEIESGPCDNADADCDGDSDPADALAIIRHLVGLPDLASDCTPIGQPLAAVH